MFNGVRVLPPINPTSETKFLGSVYEYIRSEKERLSCSEDGTDEQRYVIYSSAFNKIIDHATAYKAILANIKREYDSSIRAAQKSQYDARLAQGKLKATISAPTSLVYFQRRAAQLRERIEVIRRNTTELQARLSIRQDVQTQWSPSQRQEDSDEEQPFVGKIPGMTFEDSVNPTALARHLEYLEHKRDDLLFKRKSQYVSVQVKAQLDSKLRGVLEQRDQLAAANDKLLLSYRKIQFLNDAFGSWENSGRSVPLVEFLPQVLQQIPKLTACDSDDQRVCSSIFEEDDPSKVSESELLVDYIERFSSLFEEGAYEAAAFHAAKCPHGVLRNLPTMEKFKAVMVYKGELPPSLLFIQALMISTHSGKPHLSEALSVEGVRCAMQHNRIDLVTHWVTQQRLACSEALGDEILKGVSGGPCEMDTCLALAQVVYGTCGAPRKAAMCMCKRGMIYAAVDFICHNKGFTVDDCLFVLKNSPSITLLQALTQEHLLSLGLAVRSLVGTDHEELALQMLEHVRAHGLSALETAILDDEACSAEGWSEIAGCCERQGRPQLSQDILSVLLSQDGAVCLSPGIESAKLMEHVFM